MEHTKLTELLNKVAQGEVSVERAALELKTEPSQKDSSGSSGSHLWCW